MPKHYEEDEEDSSKSITSLILYAILFAAMAYIAKIYHFRLVSEIDHYQSSMPNNTIPLPNFRRHANEPNKSLIDSISGLKHTEKALMDWQEAFYAFRYEMTVSFTYDHSINYAASLLSAPRFSKHFFLE